MHYLDEHKIRRVESDIHANKLSRHAEENLYRSGFVLKEMKDVGQQNLPLNMRHQDVTLNASEHDQTLNDDQPVLTRSLCDLTSV